MPGKVVDLNQVIQAMSTNAVNNHSNIYRADMSEKEALELYKSMYNMGTLRHGYMGGNSELQEFSSATLNLPKTITKIWLYRLVGETPSITYGDEPLDLDKIPYIKLISQGLAYGKIVVIPYLNTIGEYQIEIRTMDEIKELSERNGRIYYLNYKTNETDNTYIYNRDNDSYQYIQKDNFHETADIVIDNVKPQPFICNLESTDSRTARPVWSDGYHLIEDCNKTYHEMMNAMELLRPIVGIPQSLTRDKDRRGGNIPYSMSSLNRMFAVIPGLEGDQLNWNYFGGTFDPEPYVKTLNMQLANLGQAVGLGKTYLKYEDKAPERRTATEVEFSMNDVFIYQKLLAKQIESWVIQLVAQMFEAYSINYNMELIGIEFEDSIHNSATEDTRQLEFDLVNEVIQPEFYLKQRYPEKLWDYLDFNIKKESEHNGQSRTSTSSGTTTSGNTTSEDSSTSG